MFPLPFAGHLQILVILESENIRDREYQDRHFLIHTSNITSPENGRNFVNFCSNPDYSNYNVIFSSLSGNLQRPKEVFEAGLRGRVLGPRQHGHHGRLVHTQRHQRRRGWSRIFI